jgi:flagellar biogenesis protein FliO
MLVPLLLSGEASTTQHASPVLALERPAATSGELSVMLRRLVLGTAVVLALCVGTLWASAKWLKRGETKQGGQLQIIARVALDRRSQVFLIRARGQRLLAGVDIGGLKTLVPVSALPEGDPEQILPFRPVDNEVRKESRP